MDKVLERAIQNVVEGTTTGRAERALLEGTLERSRKQIEDLAATAAELGASIPEEVGAAVREGIRADVLPVGRQIAEIRGLFNQTIRRLERLEDELAAERHARVEDLQLLVSLVTAAWRSVDARLDRSDQAHLAATLRILAAIEDLPSLDSEGKPVHTAA
jgi:chromosome segregation ATPase